jgi:hypothetical protein
MKKLTPFLLFIGIMAINLASCYKNDLSKVYSQKDTLAIYLTSVERKDTNGKATYHLAMFDANGDFAIDHLTTIFKKHVGRPGKILWIKVIGSGIQEITEIRSNVTSPVIFKNGTYKTDGIWNLDLTDNLDSVRTKPVKEEYTILYIPEGKHDTIPIDPYIKVPE